MGALGTGRLLWGHRQTRIPTSVSREHITCLHCHEVYSCTHTCLHVQGACAMYVCHAHKFATTLNLCLQPPSTCL